MVCVFMNAQSVRAQSPAPGIQAVAESAFIMLTAEKRITVYFEGDGIAAGRMEHSAPLRLMQAVVERGGFKDFAHKNRIQIVREGTPLKTVRYKDMIGEPFSDSNPFLRNGDHVIVP